MNAISHLALILAAAPVLGASAALIAPPQAAPEVAAAPAAPRGNLPDEALLVLPEELNDYADRADAQVITVVHLPHTDVRTLGNSLRGLANGPSGQQGVIPVGNTQSVILSGTASHVALLTRILRLVDEASAPAPAIDPVFEVLKLEFAAAETVQGILEALLAGAGGEARILADPRTNALLVRALPEELATVRQLVAHLDVETR